MPGVGPQGLGVAADLGFGLGDMLNQQQKDLTDEELRKRRMGLSSMGTNPLNFGMTGMTGVAAADLGMLGGNRR